MMRLSKQMWLGFIDLINIYNWIKVQPTNGGKHGQGLKYIESNMKQEYESLR